MEVKGNDKAEGETEDGLSGFDLFPGRGDLRGCLSSRRQRVDTLPRYC